MFESLGLGPNLLKALDKLGIEKPTDIQSQLIPVIAGGSDVQACAKTGAAKKCRLSFAASAKND